MMPVGSVHRVFRLFSHAMPPTATRAAESPLSDADEERLAELVEALSEARGPEAVTGMDEPLVFQLSRQWHCWVAKFGKDNR